MKPHRSLHLVLWFLCAASLTANAQQAAQLTMANRPFSPAIQAGETLYLSGQLGLDPTTNKPPDDPAAEVRQVMSTVRATLEKAGMTMDDLVSVQIFCSDLSLYGVFNKEYVTFFQKSYPARAFLGVKDLLFGAHFEVMGVAVRHAAESKKLLGTTH